MAEDDEIELDELGETDDRLPDGEIEAINKIFQTIEGQTQIATSKIGELIAQILEKETKEDKPSEDRTKLQSLNEELQAQIELISDL